MKKAYILLATVAFQSCNDTKNKNTQHTPAALKDNSVTEISSYTRYSDIVEKLYKDLVENNPRLKQLESDIKVVQSQSNKVKNDYNKYNDKSINYYSSANSKIADIKDSLLRLQMMALVKNSQVGYSQSTIPLNSLINTLNTNNTDINDHHTLLKIALTLPLLEQYQHDNLPSVKPFEEAIEEQKKIVKEIDKSSPKL